jgi:hypothetical protein
MEDDFVARGYLLMPNLHDHCSRGDYEAASAVAVEAAEIGERFGDRDLITLALMEEGHALVRQGRVAEGLRLVDETMVAVTTEALSPIIAGTVYCNTIAFCQGVFELGRAREWTEAQGGLPRGQPVRVGSSAGPCALAPGSRRRRGSGGRPAQGVERGHPAVEARRHGYWSTHARLGALHPELAIARPTWRDYEELPAEEVERLRFLLTHGSRRCVCRSAEARSGPESSIACQCPRVTGRAQARVPVSSPRSVVCSRNTQPQMRPSRAGRPGPGFNRAGCSG